MSAKMTRDEERAKFRRAQMDCLARRAAGMSNPRIAAALHVAEATVKSRLRKLVRDLGARSVDHAIDLCWINGSLTQELIDKAVGRVQDDGADR